jgi:hypothetical protein
VFRTAFSSGLQWHAIGRELSFDCEPAPQDTQRVILPSPWYSINAFYITSELSYSFVDINVFTERESLNKSHKIRRSGPKPRPWIPDTEETHLQLHSAGRGKTSITISLAQPPV